MPVVLLLLDYWPLRRWPTDGGDRTGRRWRLVREEAPLFAIAFGGAVLQVASQRWSEGLRSLDDIAPALRFAGAVAGAASYLRRMVWPVELAVPYPLPTRLPSLWALAAATGCLAGISVAVGLWGRRRPYLVTGWLWYLVTLAPVSGVVSIGHQITADRYTYVPLIGLWLALAWLVEEAVRDQPRWRLAAGAAAVVALLSCCVADVCRPDARPARVLARQHRALRAHAGRDGG